MVNQRNHNSQISIGKGICIALMVIGHSGCPPILLNFLALFHMPFFFFVSGYLLKEEYIDHPVILIKKRIKTLWWPYVKYGLLFLLLHNVFYLCLFYENPYTIAETIQNSCKLVFLLGHEELIGGFWFIRYLFYGLIMAILLLFVCKKMRFKWLRGGYFSFYLL